MRCIFLLPDNGKARVIGHFVCFLMSMKLVFIGLYWHLFFSEKIFEGGQKVL